MKDEKKRTHTHTHTHTHTQRERETKREMLLSYVGKNMMILHWKHGLKANPTSGFAVFADLQ